MNLDEYFEKLYEKADWGMIPDYMHQSLRDWVEHGWLPGQFLQAVLAHNLWEAAFNADGFNNRDLADWARFLHWYIPKECHGSSEIVRDWEARGGFRGKNHGL